MLSAAVIGSMVPDFGIFLPWHPTRTETHGLPAILTFILPVGLCALWLFEYVIKQPTVAVLPERLYRIACGYCSPAPIGELRVWLVACAGIVSGAVTHLVWDAFTHEGARGMRMIPALDELVFAAGHHHLAGQRLLQDVSSLIGFAVIAWWLVRQLRASGAAPAPRYLRPAERGIWLSAYLIVAVLVTVSAVFLMRDPESGRLLAGNATNEVAVAALRGLGASLLLVSVALRLRLRSL